MRRLPFVLVVTAFAAGCSLVASDSTTGSGAELSVAPAGPPEPLDFGPRVPGTAPEHSYTDEQIARGEFLARVGDCSGCHTPWNIDPEFGLPVPDMSRLLSGHPRNLPEPATAPGPGDGAVMGATNTAWRFPFGTVYTVNLTPDIETGTGAWTEQMFLDIFRKGRHLGGNGRAILPPMPWPNIASLPDEDIIAIFAYLRSIPPIQNAVPPSEIPPPVLEAIARATDALLEEMAAGGGE